MQKEVLIISRYFAPHIVVDSDAVYQMIVKLKQINKNLKIHVVTTDSMYKSEMSDQTKYDAEILKNICVHYIKPVDAIAQSPAFKFLANLIEGYCLVKKARSIKIDNIISLSNPPLISLWCTWLLKKKKLFYWTFDIYPDALVAEEILSESNVIYKIFKWLTYKNSPKVLISLGMFQYKFLCSKFKKNIPGIILPCGIHNEIQIVNTSLPEWANKNRIIIGYIGNVGRAHSLCFLKNVITGVSNTKDVTLILSIYGYYKDAVMAHLSQIDADNIIQVKFLDKVQLANIDIHLVSLKESWNNISVPSKAVSAVCSGGSLWFCGPENSDTWGMFSECSYRTNDQLEDINKTLQLLNFDDIKRKKANALLIKSDLLSTEDIAYNSILDKL